MFKPISAPDWDHIIHFLRGGYYNLYMTVYSVPVFDTHDGVKPLDKIIEAIHNMIPRTNREGFCNYRHIELLLQFLEKAFT